MSDRRSFLARAATWTLALLVPTSALAWWWSDPEMVLGVVAGAAIGLGNLALLARALGRVLAEPDQHRPAPGRTWALPAVLLLKWPLVLLALAVVLWYLPARPEGVAVGVLLSLLAASVAGLRGSRATGSDSTPRP